MGCSVFEASVFCAKYYLVQVKKWEESEMLDKKFKRESLKWISMTCFSDHAENVVFSTYSISALVLYSANWYKSCRSFCRPQMSYSAVKNKYIFNHSEKKKSSIIWWSSSGNVEQLTNNNNNNNNNSKKTREQADSRVSQVWHATECVRGNSSVSNRNQNFSENSLTSQISQSILIGWSSPNSQTYLKGTTEQNA